MGLDMMIFKKNTENKTPSLLVYWNEANQIRQWFVEHTELKGEDNCRRIPLTREVLVSLVNDCKRILDNQKTDGNIFDSTDYEDIDDFYSELDGTIQDVGKLLMTIPEEEFINGNIYYYDWW